MNNNLITVHCKASFISPKASHSFCSSSYRCGPLARKGDVTCDLSQAASRVSVSALKLSAAKHIFHFEICLAYPQMKKGGCLSEKEPVMV